MTAQLLASQLSTTEPAGMTVRDRLLAHCDTDMLAPVVDYAGSQVATHAYLPFRPSPLAR